MKKMYHKETNIENLFSSKYLFITAHSDDTEKCIKDYGKDKIYIPPPNIFKDTIFINITALESPLQKEYGVFFICDDIDVSSFKQDKIMQHILDLEYDSQEYQAGNETKNKKAVNDFYFINCVVGEISSESLILSPTNKFRKNVHFYYCKILELIFSGTNTSNEYAKNIVNCEIQKLEQSNDSMERFYFYNNSVKNLITSAKIVDLRNLNIDLFHHRNIDNSKISSDNVSINFNPQMLKSELSSQKGYWNTYIYLRELKSMSSEKLEIEKYINFFDSRFSKFKSFLFWFHNGYANILKPSVFSFSLLILNYLVLFHGLELKDTSLVYIFYPIDLFKNVIFKDFSFSNYFSGFKLFAFVFEMLFIYSTVSLGIALKKIYGFKLKM